MELIDKNWEKILDYLMGEEEETDSDSEEDV